MGERSRVESYSSQTDHYDEPRVQRESSKEHHAAAGDDSNMEQSYNVTRRGHVGGSVQQDRKEHQRQTSNQNRFERYDQERRGGDRNINNRMGKSDDYQRGERPRADYFERSKVDPRSSRGGA